jgi:hypothetical protein
VTVALLFLGGSFVESASALEISGRREFSGEVVIPKGETWRLLPGTALSFRGGRMVVRGKLIAQGTPEKPVRVTGDDVFEGLDFRGEDGSAVEHAVISGGRRGAQVTNAQVAFRSVRWEGNGIGLDVAQYAKVKADNCAFLSPLRVGILVKRGGTAEIAGTRFEGAGKAGIYVFGAKDVSVTDCRFENNDVGLLASMYGAKVTVRGSVFRGNGTGLLAEKMAEPEVAGCEFDGNRTGLRFSRRADGKVSGSRIVGNGDGVLVEYSSYPVFRKNHFDANREVAVRLRNQSSHWEEERGETDREYVGGPGGSPFGGMLGGRSDFAPGGEGTLPGKPPGKKASLTGTVDFRGNDWGESVEEVKKGGNVAAIHDGHDEPTFEYKGERYRMDRVLLR